TIHASTAFAILRVYKNSTARCYTLSLHDALPILYDKLWEMHEVKRRDDGSSLIYIDRHILHEVTSPQAFEGLRLAGRQPWRIDRSEEHTSELQSRDNLVCLLLLGQ